MNTIFVLADYGYVLKHLINYTSINVDLGQILRENLIFLEYIFLILSSFQLKFSAFDWWEINNTGIWNLLSNLQQRKSFPEAS